MSTSSVSRSAAMEGNINLIVGETPLAALSSMVDIGVMQDPVARYFTYNPSRKLPEDATDVIPEIRFTLDDDLKFAVVQQLVTRLYKRNLEAVSAADVKSAASTPQQKKMSDTGLKLFRALAMEQCRGSRLLKVYLYVISSLHGAHGRAPKASGCGMCDDAFTQHMLDKLPKQLSDIPAARLDIMKQIVEDEQADSEFRDRVMPLQQHLASLGLDLRTKATKGT